MKRVFARVAVTLFVGYAALQLVLGSRPVQSRIVEALRAELKRFGLIVTVESIEFSTLVPKMYVNRVQIERTGTSPIDLPKPLRVDKIKIAFQPLALLSRTLQIQELVLYNPRLEHAAVDHLVETVTAALPRTKGQKTTSPWRVAIRSVGVVDAVLDLAVPSQALRVRTPSFTAIVRFDSEKQQNLTIDTRKLDLEHKGQALAFASLRADVDRVAETFRINRLEMEGDDISGSAKGTIASPEAGQKLPARANLGVKLRVALPWLSDIEGAGLPEMGGSVSVEGDGSLLNAGSSWSFAGLVQYADVAVQGYRIGSGKFRADADPKRAVLRDVELRWANGTLKGPTLELGLESPFRLRGALKLENLELRELLKNVRAGDAPLSLPFSGAAQVDGSLKPFALDVKSQLQFPKFDVLNEKDIAHPDLVVGGGTVEGLFSFDKEALRVGADLTVLDGRVKATGRIGYGSDVGFHFEGNGVSLTKLREIAGLPVGGNVELSADLATENGKVRIAGGFSAEKGSVARIELGAVKGRALYQNDLLTFERLELAALDPILGQGFVDFAPKRTHYRITADARRIALAQGFGAIRAFKPPFPEPEGGDGSFRLALEGGHDEKGVEVRLSGKARNFKWLEESWAQATYQFVYRADMTILEQLVLGKKGGSVSVAGEFGAAQSRLALELHRLRLEELQHLPPDALSGEANGRFSVTWKKGEILQAANGEGRLTGVRFRGRPVPEWRLAASGEAPQPIRFTAEAEGDGHFRAEWRRRSQDSSDVKLDFDKFDFAPILAAVLRTDFSSLTEVRGSGSANIDGNPLEPLAGKGSVALQELVIGLKGRPMRTQKPVQFTIEKEGIFLSPFRLESTDSVLDGFLRWRRNGMVEGRLDGTVDLEFLYPFIPGLEYGVGIVSTGIQLSGPVDRFRLVGNISLENGAFRLRGMPDELRSVRAQIGLDERKMSVNRFEAAVNGGALAVSGDVRHDRFRLLSPDLKLRLERVEIHPAPALLVRASGDLTLRGAEFPLLIAGKCLVHEARLVSLAQPGATSPADNKPPALAFQLHCDAPNSVFVQTDLLQAEMRGSVDVTGTSDKPGLLGSLDATSGSMVFRDTRFALTSGTVRFESSERIRPRFSVLGRALVKERTSLQGEEYEVTLNVAGVPEEYRIRLSASPALLENQIISLLMLGYVGKGQDGNFADLGSAVAGQIPIQSKLQDQLGVDIRIRQTQPNIPQVAAAGGTTTTFAPSVQIQKDVTKKTKLSYSSSLDAVPIREFRIEQILDENLTVNATAADNPRGIGATQNQQPSQSYGVDFRYRFNFE